MKRSLLFGFPPLLLAGCALVQLVQYEHPTDDNAAKLTFVNASGGTLVIDGFVDSQACTGLLNLSEKSKRWVNLSDVESEQVTLRPNEELSFSFNYSRHPDICHLVGTFTPRERGRYIATFAIDHSSCSISMTSVENGKEVVEKSFRGRKTRKQHFSPSESACEPEFPRQSSQR